LGASGSSTGSFLFSHGILSTTGAYDLAEDYATRDDSLAAGDLITIDPYETGFVRKSTGLGDKAIVGIYSTNPALRLSQKDSTINGGRAVPVALAGRVPVKVSTENGVIASGDPLTSSSIPGVAMKATSNSRIVGMAMENYTSSDPTAIGKVVVFVNPNWYSGITQGGTADLNTLNATDLTVTGTAIINTLNVTGAATIETLTVTGNASLSELTVTGVTTLKDLVVTGAASLKIVTVERIITSGEAPTVVPLAHAGLNSTATVEGNDTAGTIMLTTGDGAQVSSGEVVELTFTSPLERTPRVNLSPLNGATAGMQWYIERTMTSVKIYFTGTPTAATEYKFDYQILE
jgi:hypothetical protein